MGLAVVEDFIHKNRGLKIDGTPMVRLTRVDLGTIQMKTKSKVGPVDAHLAEIPKDECVSRLINWRKLLKAGGDPKTSPGPESNPRKVAFVFDGPTLLMALVWVTKDDPQEWDSQPSDWKGEGWVPFFVAFRYKDPTLTVVDLTDDDE